ncbi:MAG: nucleotide exchange factor GrpE [gamma proteobacterium symbiont of Phacoides pectinatus]
MPGGSTNETAKEAGGGEDCLQALAACREESEARLQALLRARADLDNQAKRAARELEKTHKYAVSGLVEALLPVQDSLELGLAAARSDTDVETLRQGMALTLEKLQGVLAKFGVEAVDPVGEAFDPERHEAMSVAPTADLPPNSVAEVHQKGYLLNGRLIRPARVVVSTQPVPGSQPDEQDNPGA